MTRRPSTWIWGLWAGSFLLSVLCLGTFAWGILRDSNFRDVRAKVDLSTPGRLEQEFSVARLDERVLYLTSINHSPPFDVPFGGSASFQIIAPQGDTALAGVIDSKLGHLRPDNMDWSTLGSFQPDTRGRFRLIFEVAGPDSIFQGVNSGLVLRPNQPSVGMEGLITYAMVVPGGILLVVACCLSLLLHLRGGPRWPLFVTLASMVILLAAIP